ncbi:MAG: ATP-binding protein, partial [Phycisphaerae bacterium]
MLLDVIECSPQQIVSEVRLLLGRRAADKGLSFETCYSGPIPKTMRTDPTRLRQILIKLVGNAIKFTRSGGVRIEVKMATAPDAPDPRLSFSVIDTGIGMSSEQLQRLFQPFVQAEASTTRHYGGTGLGLTISKQLVEALGGEIAVDSAPGKGSTPPSCIKIAAGVQKSLCGS